MIVNWLTILDKSLTGYEYGKCYQNQIINKKCQIGSRCIEESECHVKCDAVTRDTCTNKVVTIHKRFTPSYQNVELKDGCMYCDGKVSRPEGRH